MPCWPCQASHLIMLSKMYKLVGTRKTSYCRLILLCLHSGINTFAYKHFYYIKKGLKFHESGFDGQWIIGLAFQKKKKQYNTMTWYFPKPSNLIESGRQKSLAKYSNFIFQYSASGPQKLDLLIRFCLKIKKCKSLTEKNPS